MKLFGFLGKTADKITDALRGAVGLPNGRVPQKVLDELEDALILSDLGLELATEAVEALSKHRFADGDNTEHVKEWLANWLTAFFPPAETEPEFNAKPTVVLMIGVNGAGKTTSLGKLAHQYKRAGKSVLLAAGDTFRAGAGQQLKVWAQRAKVECLLPEKEGQDAAGFLFDAYEKALENQTDILLCDTAGRLQNRTDLMDELAKIIRVLQKQNSNLPHQVYLTLDATVGQNALQQVELFNKMTKIDGLVLNKLDGSAKAGVVVQLAKTYSIPILYVGTGEKIEDIQTFNAKTFTRALVGLAA